MEDNSKNQQLGKTDCDLNSNATMKEAFRNAPLSEEGSTDDKASDSDCSANEEFEKTPFAPSSSQTGAAKVNVEDLIKQAGTLNVTENENPALVSPGEDDENWPGPGHVNGLCFGEQKLDIPTDIMEIILSYADLRLLPALREVCVAWNELIDAPYFWHRVMEKGPMLKDWGPIFDHIADHKDGWMVFYSMIRQHFLNSNLVKNPSGEHGFENWTHMSGEVGGWTIDARDGLEILGIAPFNEEAFGPTGFCFGTNNYSCSKEQDVDLWEHGLTPAIMRAIVPFAITWTEYVAAPVDHDGVYEAECSLLDSSLGPISPYSPYQYRARQVIPGGTSWRPFQKRFIVNRKNEHEVCEELRYVHIFHGGLEVGSTEGHWGPRMAGCSVVVSLLKSSEDY